jgi:hypothetical protein
MILIFSLILGALFYFCGAVLSLNDEACANNPFASFARECWMALKIARYGQKKVMEDLSLQRDALRKIDEHERVRRMRAGRPSKVGNTGRLCGEQSEAFVVVDFSRDA